MNNSKKVYERYGDENPKCLIKLAKHYCLKETISEGKCVYSEVFATFIIADRLCKLTKSNPIELATYIMSECQHSTKLAPWMRTLKKEQIITISNAYNIKVAEDILKRFDSSAPSRSLPMGEKIRVEPYSKKCLEHTQYSGRREHIIFTGDASIKGIVDSNGAAKLACTLMNSGSWMVK